MELWEISSDFDAIDIDRDTMAICNPQMREAYTLYNAALEKIRFGKSNEARIDLRKATQLYPGFDDAYILLGLCIFASGNRIDAMRTFNQINDGEKHNAAMRYFDMLSESSRDVVTGYKQNQNYREPVRAVGAVFKEIDNNSPEERQRRKAAEDAFAFFAENSEISHARSDSESAADFFDNVDKKVHASTGNSSADGCEPYASRSGIRSNEGPVQERVIRNAEGQTNSGVKTHTPEKKHASEKIRISENTASPERGRETVKDELNAGRRNDGIAGSGSSPDPSMEKSTALRRDENERSAYDGKKAAASGRALPRRQNKNMIMVLIAVCCFIVLIITAVIVTAANRDKFFGENSILRAPGGKPSNSADAVATPGDSSASPDNTSDMTPSGNTPGPASTADPTPLSEELLKKAAEEKLAEANELFKKRSFYECYAMLDEYDWSYLPGELKASLEEVRSSSFTAFCNEYYNLMYSNVSPENWDKVLEYGLILIKYCPDYERGAPVYFNIGKAYESKGDKVNAAKYYELTIEKYPDSNDARYATYRLSRL